MATNPVHIVDVFAQGKYTGNQLAVVHEAANLSTDEMLAFTRETNFSEATFIETAGRDVIVYTIDSWQEARQSLELNVDEVIVNYPSVFDFATEI
ncbi:hypothetical protein HAPAU_37640 [Halalkalicoccus paucihalophilus]|uniref:Uncharacterized protein n=1 Tax=Halalkalicoccus paucihalophilus TaxID=1008153 RepID=A0A151A8X2_9EURY|nr:PhzF family phenazine biosynthesis protein [Halalkalicoccus paucihalophilus]KYH24121.1 hypothetical protein HAPAU_37640 [Halalkalicoccus paucihalophilus]